jgi:GTP-binding protein Era
LERVRAEYQALVPDTPALAFSAASHQGLKELLEAITARLPVRPAEYPEDQITDLYEKEIAAELIREAALVFLRDEVPHALAVRMDEFSERENGNAFISATLLVEHESQKGIVIGEKAAMLKKIGSAARMEIEAMSGRKVFLELRVKVDKDWRDDENALRRLGYKVKTKK